MERFLVPFSGGDKTYESQTAQPHLLRGKRCEWSLSAREVEGRRVDSMFRRQSCRILVDSFSETMEFRHRYSNYYRDGDNHCATHMDDIFDNFSDDLSTSSRKGIFGLDFDAKGMYLAAVTGSGCLTIHDFERLYSSVNDLTSKTMTCVDTPLLHIRDLVPMIAVRWNPWNEDEVVCVSEEDDEVTLFDICDVTLEPTQVLKKRKSKFHGLIPEQNCGFSDVIFASKDAERVLASGIDGAVYIWDRRMSNRHCLELLTAATSPCRINSLELDVENRVVFGGSKHGFIYAWDIRGGRASAAFQSYNEVPLLASLKISSMLEKITSLKVQSNIVSKEINSVDLDPSCPHQLAFHLDDGWSGVLNVRTLNVTHIHCPPPDWLECTDSLRHVRTRRPCWLPSCSVYAVGSSSRNGIYLLDFRPDATSPCHVDFKEEDESMLRENRAVAGKKFVSLSREVLSCVSHPSNSAIIAGTKESSLILMTQKGNVSRE